MICRLDSRKYSEQYDFGEMSRLLGLKESESTEEVYLQMKEGSGESQPSANESKLQASRRSLRDRLTDLQNWYNSLE